MQRNAKAVDLQLGYIVELTAFGKFFAPFGKRFEIVKAVRIVLRHQRHGMCERPQTVGLSANPLRRAVGGDQFRMFSLESL